MRSLEFQRNGSADVECRGHDQGAGPACACAGDQGQHQRRAVGRLAGEELTTHILLIVLKLSRSSEALIYSGSFICSYKSLSFALDLV